MTDPAGSVYQLPVSGIHLRRDADGWSIYNVVYHPLRQSDSMVLLDGGHCVRLWYQQGVNVNSVVLPMADALWVASHVGIDIRDPSADITYAVGTLEALMFDQEI